MSQFSPHVRQVSSTDSTRIVGLFPALLGVGGVQEAGRQTAAALDEIARQRKWDLQLLSLNDGPGLHAIRVGGREIPLVGFGRAKKSFVWSALGFGRKNTSIVLAAHPHLALPAELMKIRYPSLKTIVMSHGIEVWRPLPILRRLALRLADWVLAPSSDTARKLSEVQSVPRGKVIRVPWPVNEEMLRLATDALAPQPPPGFPTGQVILTVGRWVASEGYKGADDLIEAIAILCESMPELRLAAVGSGDDLPRLRKLAFDRGVADRVSFFEGLSREQIAGCYARCTIFALPSTGEGFGLVFLEAMAFAKPVIGAESGGVPDLIENGVTGLLVPPRDKRKLAEALKHLLSDSELRAHLGSRGAEMVCRRYTFEAFETALERIIDDALIPTHPESNGGKLAT